MAKFVFWATLTTWAACMALAALVLLLNHRSADGSELKYAISVLVPHDGVT